MDKIDHNHNYKIFDSKFDPRTGFEIGSQEYNDYYFPKIKKEKHK